MESRQKTTCICLAPESTNQPVAIFGIMKNKNRNKNGEPEEGTWKRVFSSHPQVLGTNSRKTNYTIVLSGPSEHAVALNVLGGPPRLTFSPHTRAAWAEHSLRQMATNHPVKYQRSKSCGSAMEVAFERSGDTLGDTLGLSGELDQFAEVGVAQNTTLGRRRSTTTCTTVALAELVF